MLLALMADQCVPGANFTRCSLRAVILAVTELAVAWGKVSDGHAGRPADQRLAICEFRDTSICIQSRFYVVPSQGGNLPAAEPAATGGEVRRGQAGSSGGPAPRAPRVQGHRRSSPIWQTGLAHLLLGLGC